MLLKPAPLELFRVFPEAAKDANVLLAGGRAWVPFDDTIYGQASAMSTSAMAGKFWKGKTRCGGTARHGTWQRQLLYLLVREGQTVLRYI